jgi:hypothetical protein
VDTDAEEEKAMLDERGGEKAQRQTAKFTEQYRHAKGMGYNITTMGLPTYETQEDFDKYRPQDAGSSFEHENEFIAEILKGLLANNVPAKPVTIRNTEFVEWLNGRENSSSNRASYCGHLVARGGHENERSR